MPSVPLDHDLPTGPAGRDHEAFRVAWWLRSAHLQTLWQTLFRHHPGPKYRTLSRVELDDGDFVDLHWAAGGAGPIVLLLHGLEGSSRSKNVRGLARAVLGRGWRAVVMNFRGCSGVPNRRVRAYHAGDTGDLAQVVKHLHDLVPEPSIGIVGVSLGGNVLLKWLAEGAPGGSGSVKAAVAISAPMVLAEGVKRLNQGFSRVYQAFFVRGLCRKLRRKFAERPAPVDLGGRFARWTLREFDDRVTAPLHGFADADDYFERASSRGGLGKIRVPTLIIHAGDDPLMTSEVFPEPGELPPSVRPEKSDRGGHVGFISGRVPLWPDYWLETRVPGFLEQFL